MANRGFFNPNNFQRIEWELLTKLPHRYWKENIRTKRSLLCHVRNVQLTPIFITVNITEDAVESVEQKNSGGFRPGGYVPGSFTGVVLKNW